jgi:uncharacterized protein (TIGR02270 family)
MMSSYGHHQGAYRDVYEQYVDVASFLWVLRAIAVHHPHYAVQDIQALEHRLEAQLDGAMTSLEDAWRACEAALAIGEPGEVFTATVIAMRSHDVNRIRLAVEHGLAKGPATAGLISALGWLPDPLVQPWIEKLLHGKDLNHKYLGLAACSVRRHNPGEVLASLLQRDDCRHHEKLYARAMRLIGELRRQDVMPAVTAGRRSDNATVRFWSVWSAILLGDRSAVDQLKPYVMVAGPWHDRALQLAFRVLPIESARRWISDMVKNPALGRSVVQATGVLGDPHAVHWLIARMADTRYARVAGEAFTQMTSADLEALEATVPPPKEPVAGPTDAANDEDVALDPDEYLPWPDPAKVAALWQRAGQHFIVGQRYFHGRPLAPEILKDQLIHGYQRQRHAAALELALVDAGHPLINTTARAVP